MKLIIKSCLALVILSVFSCSKESLVNTKTAVSQESDDALQSSVTHRLGDRFGGGVIFYVDKTRTHGLIADVADLGTFSWRIGNLINITGANKTALGTGSANTRKIIQVQGTSGNCAALACDNSTNGGYTDWYLPSKDELYQLYLQRDKVGGFAPAHYWSSSETTGNSADYASWAMYFPNGSEYTEYKYSVINVRAIRAF